MTAHETVLNGESILSIPDATPTGLALELRSARRGHVLLNLCKDNQVVAYINNVHLSQVMVGRITDELHCLFLGPAVIDISPAAAATINEWMARTILKDVSA